MSWFEEIEITEAEGQLAQAYAELLKKRGKVADILQVPSGPTRYSNPAWAISSYPPRN